MRVTLRYTGQLAGAAGASEEEVECSEGEPLLNAIRKLAEDGRDPLYGKLVLTSDGGLQPTVLMVVDGEQVSGDKDAFCADNGTVVTLMTPIAGG